MSSMRAFTPAFSSGDAYLQDLNLYHFSTFDATTAVGPMVFGVPNLAGLTGIPITAQVLLATGELSGPTSGILVP